MRTSLAPQPAETVELPGRPQAGPARHRYGDYILRTGQENVGALELVYGAHWFQSRFGGMQPILDLGPGRCWFAKQNPCGIIAVDTAPELVEHYGAQGIDIRLGSAYEIPFAPEFFQAVFCCWLFEHLTQPDCAMGEIHRVLQTGGYACIIVPSPRDMVAFYDDYTHVRPFTPISLRQLAEDAGFAKCQVEYLPWARGLSFVRRFCGYAFALRYLRFSESAFRRVGLVNKNHLMLEAWK